MTHLTLQVNTVVTVEPTGLANEAPRTSSGLSCISVTVHDNSINNNPNKNVV